MMPIIESQAQRDALIAEIKYNREHCFLSSKTEMLMKIALAALEANTAGKVLGNDWISEDDRGTHYWVEWAGGKFPPKGTEVYTAPPVPMLKPVVLPEGDIVYHTATDTYGEYGCEMLPVSTIRQILREAGYPIAGEDQ